MRKGKKIIAMVLVLAFMFAFMAMSVSAATTIMPRATCSKCGSGDSVTTTTLIQSYNEYVGGCSKIASAHNHVHKQYKNTIVCRGCGNTTSNTYWTVACA